MRANLTVSILTYNEEANLERTLSYLTWAEHILVIDSYSSDRTLEILAACPRIRVLQRQFDSFAGQCNFGLDRIETPWVLSLDADYTVTPELAREIQALPDDPDCQGYYARFKYAIFGKPLRGTILPPRQVLYRRDKARYVDDGHAHRVGVEGRSRTLTGYIHHDDRKPLSRWVASQDRYMVKEVHKLLATPHAELSRSDRLRKGKLWAPFVVLAYCLILKGGILDGWQGWYYALQRCFAELLLAIRLIETERLRADATVESR